MGVNDKQLRSISDREKLIPWSGTDRPTPIALITTVKTKDGRELKAMVSDIKGTPDSPLNDDELRDKFLMLTRDYDRGIMESVINRLQNIEDEVNIEWISA